MTVSACIIIALTALHPRLAQECQGQPPAPAGSPPHMTEKAHKVEVLLVAENLRIPYWPFFQIEMCALDLNVSL